ncbi:hypothetical protein [Aquimarina longa]|uniref:hypothetical protein n=1 Tax=Aquimarina longa TaxID=1080221 RepID=UPI00078083CF|nr:hypothetical protein [Aquimarina longa]
MKNYDAILLLFYFCTSLSAYSQNISITIGESTTNKLTKNKSAQVLATFPKNDTLDNSWLVNGYLELKLDSIGTSNYSIGILNEIHKNTLISKEQDNRQFGVSLEKDFLIKKKTINYDGKTEQATKARFITNATFKHSYNVLKKEKSFIANLGTSFSLERSKNLRFLQTNTRLININKGFGKILTVTHNHNFGISYLGGYDNVLLGDASFSIKLLPLSGLMNQIKQPDFFQVQYHINVRTEILGNTEKDLNTLHTLSAGIQYKIDKKSSVGISYGFQKGANPYTALEDQEFETISARLRLVLE